MRVWLDTEKNRPREQGWVHCSSVNEIITLLQYNDQSNIQEVSLAMNLGKLEENGGTPVKLIKWFIDNDYWPKRLTLHGKPDDFGKVLKSIKERGPYTAKNGMYTWVK